MRLQPPLVCPVALLLFWISSELSFRLLRRPWRWGEDTPHLSAETAGDPGLDLWEHSSTSSQDPHANLHPRSYIQGVLGTVACGSSGPSLSLGHLYVLCVARGLLVFCPLLPERQSHRL